MKSFSEFRATLIESTPVVEEPASTQIDEETVHLKPHGNKGTHYKVVKGIKGHLEAGEVISDTHVDDLHDMGYKVKHLKEGEEGQLDEISATLARNYKTSAASPERENGVHSTDPKTVEKRKAGLFNARDKLWNVTKTRKVLATEDVDALTDEQLDEMSVEDLEALEQQLSEEHDAAFLAEDKAKAKKVAKTTGRVEDAVTKKKGKPAPMHKG